jgi:hypothetical protein
MEFFFFVHTHFHSDLGENFTYIFLVINKLFPHCALNTGIEK